MMQPAALNNAVQDMTNSNHEIDMLVHDFISCQLSHNWSRAHELRKQINELGIELVATPEGTKWRYRQ